MRICLKTAFYPDLYLWHSLLAPRNVHRIFAILRRRIKEPIQQVKFSYYFFIFKSVKNRKWKKKLWNDRQQRKKSKVFHKLETSRMIGITEKIIWDKLETGPLSPKMNQDVIKTKPIIFLSDSSRTAIRKIFHLNNIKAGRFDNYPANKLFPNY